MTATMMTDKRSERAAAMLATTAVLVKGRDARGEFYAVPSTSKHSRRVYRVTEHDCSCPDFQNSGFLCKHSLAVRLHLARVREQRPAATQPPMSTLRERVDAYTAELFGDDWAA